MATLSATLTRTTERSRVVVSPGILLGLIVALGAAVRLPGAFARSTPLYFPDEFLYAQLANSIANGRGIAVMGVPSSFPALLEPLLAAPLWRTGDAELTIRLTQSLHALLMALAAVPVYMLARRVGISTHSALLCALATVLAPPLFFSASLGADAVGYLLALVAVDAAVRALAHPTPSTQALFLGTAAVATFARLQYAILVPAFVIAALVVERGRLLRAVKRFGLTAALMGTLLLAGLAIGSRALGRYETVSTFGLSEQTGRWFLTSLLLGGVAAGVATTPGALAWVVSALRTPNSRERAGLAAMLAALTGLLLMAAAVMSVETGSDRFLERYLIVVFPLVTLGFVCWLDQGRPARLVALGSAFVMLVAVARLPFSGYTAGQGVADSPTLLALRQLEQIVGHANASLIAATLMSTGLIVALGLALTPRLGGWIALTVSFAVFAGIAVGAPSFERSTSRTVLAGFLRDPGNPSWIDQATPGPVTLIQTPESTRIDAMLLGIWNRSITRVLPLGARRIEDLDGLGESVRVGAAGELVGARGPLREPVAFALGGVAAAFDDTRRVIYDRRFVLAVPRDKVRLAMLAEGLRFDGKLSPSGRLLVFPTRDGRCTRLDIRLAVPRGVPATKLELLADDGSRELLRVASTEPGRVTLTSRPASARILRFRTVSLGGRPPGPFVTTVATARYTSRTVKCSA